MSTFFSVFSKKRIITKLSINLENLNKNSITLVTKKISGRGSYRIYINGWTYNINPYDINKESRHSIKSSYFKEGTNIFRIVVKNTITKKEETLYKEFEYTKAG